jgi:regulatory protein
MSNADGERIAPVTYLFGARASAPEEAVAEDAAPPSAAHSANSPSAAPEQRAPVFVDLGEPAGRAAEIRAELEEEARTHLTRDRADAERAERSERSERPGRPERKVSFAPINNVSMHALARRGMSSREMHDYLIGRDFDQGAVDDEIERLESVGLLDDVALGETLVRTLRERKGLGRSGVTAELRRRNLDQTAIEIALAELDDDELERATEIAHKRASQLRSYDAETAKRRLGAFLMRKGYSGSVVSTAVQRALSPAGPTFR